VKEVGYLIDCLSKLTYFIPYSLLLKAFLFASIVEVTRVAVNKWRLCNAAPVLSVM